VSKVFVITTDRMGAANEELGHILMKNFLYSLARSDVKPRLVFLANDGVRLACADSESLDDLALLVEDGVPVLSCGTCLEYLALAETLKVGGFGKMPDLVAEMLDAEDVVTIA
jgi:selenium metabolism protein YedF